MKNLLAPLAFLALYFLCAQPLLATFNLRVGDPRTSWSTQKGTIEEAVLSVRPKGLYLEYGLYLTFSARGTTYKPQDSLEVTLLFELPENAIVHDSWLWIYDDIARARIMDRWTASSIYENIVQRRQDPSLLFKNSATQYELRVFPMRGDETRKVKITWLMPADWSRETVEADLPIQILQTSRYAPDPFQVFAWTDDDFKNPALLNPSGLSFEGRYSPDFGPYYQVGIPVAAQQTGLRIAFESPLKRGNYISAHQEGQGGFYQMAVLPSLFFGQESGRKIVLLVDQEAGAGAISASSLLLELKHQFARQLSPLDSFNIMVSGLTPKPVSTDWLPADSLHLAAAFQSAEALLVSYSNLASLLIGGIDFIKAKGGKGNILAASNASQYGNYTSANVLLSDLRSQLGEPPIAVHTLNFNNSNSPKYTIGGQTYYGNDYFFVNIAKLSGGDFHTVRGTTLPLAAANAVRSLTAALQSYDFHTTLADGYCYGRFTLGDVSDNVYLNDPILQVGKFQGTFPFVVQIAGELQQKFVSAELVVPAQAIGVSDTLVREMWSGNYIQALDQGSISSADISEIIYASLNERVLSRYTAFLCLEDTTQFCPTCKDESQLVSTDDGAARDTLLSAWPNPFTDRVSLAIRAGADATLSASSVLEIYAMDGALVRRIALNGAGKKEIQVDWDGRDAGGVSVPAGVYIALARISNGQNRTLKLVRRQP